MISKKERIAVAADHHDQGPAWLSRDQKKAAKDFPPRLVRFPFYSKDDVSLLIVGASPSEVFSTSAICSARVILDSNKDCRE